MTHDSAHSEQQEAKGLSQYHTASIRNCDDLRDDLANAEKREELFSSLIAELHTCEFCNSEDVNSADNHCDVSWCEDCGSISVFDSDLMRVHWIDPSICEYKESCLQCLPPNQIKEIEALWRNEAVVERMSKPVT